MSTSSIRGEKRRRAFARTESSIRGESEKHRLSHTKISRQGCSIRPTVCVTEQDARLRASKQRNASKATRSTPLLLQTAPNAFGSRLRDLRPGLRIANNFVAKCTANESAAQRCQRPSRAHGPLQGGAKHRSDRLERKHPRSRRRRRRVFLRFFTLTPGSPL